jgi:hypothetical protein
MDSITIDGVPLVIFPSPRLQGRWTAETGGREFGVLFMIVGEIMNGRQRGWIEGLRELRSLDDHHLYAHLLREGEIDQWENVVRWSSFGGSPESDHCYMLGTASSDFPVSAIAARSLIQLLSILLERSGLDPTKTPEPLGRFDPNAEYAQLPYPPSPPPPLPLKKNKPVLAEISHRIWRLAQLQEKDPGAAHQMRLTLLSEMKEMGVFREDLISSNDTDLAEFDLSLFLSRIEKLRKYYQSAHRKTALGTASMPNAIGGPLSYQLIDHTSSWDFGDHHPHEIYARFEALMRKLSNLEGDYGERKVEEGTFKATFHWEREDGIHASLTKVIVESW